MSYQQNWKNPYRVKRKDSMVKEVKVTSNGRHAQEAKSQSSNPDFLQVLNNFREGIKGISRSISQFEKTMETMTQLYTTMEKLGGIKQLNQMFSAAPASRSQTSSSYDFNNLLGHIQTFLAMLEKIDFNQINQFLESPVIKSILTDQQKK